MNKLPNHDLQITAALALMRLNIVPGLSLAYIAAHFDEQERKLAHECENNSILLAECRRAQVGYAAMIYERDEATRKLALCREAIANSLPIFKQAQGYLEHAKIGGMTFFWCSINDLESTLEATKP